MRKLLARMRRKIADQSGNMFPLTIAVVLSMLFILLGVTEYCRLMILAGGVKDAYEEAIISVVNDNYNEVYACVREGYAAGYTPTGYGFISSVDYGSVPGRLENLLGLDFSDGTYNKADADGTVQYRISNISVNTNNTSLCQNSETFSADGTLLLSIPVRFAGHELFDLPVNLKVKAVYREKF